jgi:signal transduction histidine kinase
LAVHVIGLAGLAAGLILILLADLSDGLSQPGLHAALACWVTLPYLFAGAIAWRQRPESRLGLLMFCAGTGTFVNFLIWANNDLLFTIGLATQFLPPLLFLHVFLAFPTGRLTSRLDRLVVGSAYATSLATVTALLLGFSAPRNRLAIADLPDTASLVWRADLLSVSALMLAGIAVLIRRRLSRPRPLRRAIGYVVDSFSLGLLMIALLLLAGMLRWTALQDPLRLATFSIVGLAPIVFLAGLLQMRLSRGSVVRLIEELGVNPGPIELEQALARALRDPSVKLAYWLSDFGLYSDTDGREMDVSDRDDRTATPVTRDGTPVAMLLHAPELNDEPDLLAAVATATAITIHNAQLQVELRARVQELRGSRNRILDAERRERRRLERDLHDGAQQRLLALSLELGKLQEDLRLEPALSSRVGMLRRELAAGLAELRDLASGIHPAAVTNHGLTVALESLATRASIPVEIVGDIQRLPEAVELAAFFLVCEGLANVAKHANARSAVIELRHTGDTLVVDLTDDGIGGATTINGSGLRGLADRVEALGGRLDVWSPAGGGTRLKARIPCE